MDEKKSPVVLHPNDNIACDGPVFSKMAGIQSRKLQTEEMCVSSDASSVIAVNNVCISGSKGVGNTDKSEITNIEILKTECVNSEKKVHVGIGAQVYNKTDAVIAANSDANAVVDFGNSATIPSNSNEDSTGLHMEVKSVPRRGRRRKDEMINDSAVDKIEDEVWETVEPMLSLDSGVRRSGRKRRQKKISYLALLDDNVDSSSNKSGKSDDEWNIAAEIKSLKTEVEDPSPSHSPALSPSRKPTSKTNVKSKRKVAIKKQNQSFEDGKRTKVKNKKLSKEESTETAVVEIKEEKSAEEFRCKVCDMVFLSQHRFKNHRLTCNVVKPQVRQKKLTWTKGASKSKHSCPICRQEFAKRNGVKRHMCLKHTNLVHISCALCYKKIGDVDDSYHHFQKEHQSSFPEQKDTSTSSSSVVCPVCGYKGSKYSQMKLHLTHQHSDLIHVTCALCQRSVGTMLEYLQHFEKYHSHSPTTRDKTDEVVTTNTDAAMRMNSKPRSNQAGKESTLLQVPSSSAIDDSDLICIQCNKSIGNYKLLVLHMLSHKVEENTSIASHNSGMPSFSNSNCTAMSALSNQQTESSSSISNRKPLDEYPLPVLWLPPESLCTVNSVSGLLGPDLLIAINRSLNLMTDMSAKLTPELTWGDTDELSSKEDLLRKLNKVLRFSSGITDVAKCVLLVLEETLQLKGNPHADVDNTPIEVDCSDVLSDASNGDNDDVNDNCVKDSGNEELYAASDREIGANDGLSSSENVIIYQEQSNGVTVMTGNSDGSHSRLSMSTPTTVSGAQYGQGRVDENNLEVQNAEQSDSMVNSGIPGDGGLEMGDPVDPCRRSSQRLRAKSTVVSPSTKTTEKKRKKKYMCNKCGKLLSKKSSLTAHMLVHSNLKPFKCKKCPAAFKAEDHLKRHILLHLEDNKFKCDFCVFMHRSRLAVKSHSLEEHPDEDLFSCDLCKHKARTTLDLEIHKRIHSSRKCRQCDFEARHFYELKVHERKNHANKFCAYCSYSCSTSYLLKRHMKTHVKMEDDKIFCCELCGVTFDTNRKLEYHVIRHTNKKPLSCPQCDYKCSSRSSYDTHLLKHSGLRPYKCNLCDAAFYRTSYLKQHKLMHSDEKGFCCRYCGKGFKYKYNCHEHEMIHTGEKKFKCKLCNFACRRRKFLEQHVEEHRARGSDVEGVPGEEEDGPGTDIAGEISGLLKAENLVPIM